MRKQVISIVISMLLFIISLVVKFNNDIVKKVFFIISYLVVGFEVLKEAIDDVISKRDSDSGEENGGGEGGEARDER